MTLDTVRKKMRDLRAKTRRQLLGTLAGPLAAIFFYVFSSKEFPSLIAVLQPPFVLALVWSLAGLYFLNRGMWAATMPGDAGFSTGLEYCRREIGRRRSLLRGVLWWSFGPVLLAIATFIAALAMVGGKQHGVFPNGLPFMILVAVWIVGYFFMRLREQRELQHEAERLNDMERENRQ